MKEDEAFNMPSQFEMEVGVSKLHRNGLLWDELQALLSIVESLIQEEKEEEESKRNMMRLVRDDYASRMQVSLFQKLDEVKNGFQDETGLSEDILKTLLVNSCPQAISHLESIEILVRSYLNDRERSSFNGKTASNNLLHRFKVQQEDFIEASKHQLREELADTMNMEAYYGVRQLIASFLDREERLLGTAIEEAHSFLLDRSDRACLPSTNCRLSERQMIELLDLFSDLDLSAQSFKTPFSLPKTSPAPERRLKKKSKLRERLEEAKEEMFFFDDDLEHG